MSNTIEIYTDGSCYPNPGKGGYAAIIKKGEDRREIIGGFKYTTNNRMEMLAVIAGLESVKKEPRFVRIYSDSQYVVNAINKNWVVKWKKRDFAGVKNPDLWKRMLDLWDDSKHQLIWIKGHNGNVDNEACDALANGVLNCHNLPEDSQYLLLEKEYKKPEYLAVKILRKHKYGGYGKKRKWK